MARGRGGAAGFVGARGADEVERCRAFGAAGPLGAALRTLGTLDGDETLLEKAVAGPRAVARAASSMRSPCWRSAAPRASRPARTTPARRSGRRSTGLASCGADAVANEAHRELVAAGARPRRDPAARRTKLTAAELRVARRAAEGLSNREIAQALFLTENTVQTHLRHAFRKLAISSRSQLAGAL